MATWINYCFVSTFLYGHFLIVSLHMESFMLLEEPLCMSLLISFNKVVLFHSASLRYCTLLKTLPQHCQMWAVLTRGIHKACMPWRNRLSNKTGGSLIAAHTHVNLLNDLFNSYPPVGKHYSLHFSFNLWFAIERQSTCSSSSRLVRLRWNIPHHLTAMS